MPARRNTSTQVPSDPTRGQLAPPSARTVTSDRVIDTSPLTLSIKDRCGSNPAWRSPAQPRQRQPVLIRTPCDSSRRSHDLSNGVARNDSGNTRPLEPIQVGSPRVAHHSLRSDGPNLRSAGSNLWLAGPYRDSSLSNGSLWVMLSPPRPASCNLRPDERMCSTTSTRSPAAARCSAAMSPAGPPPTTNAVRLCFESFIPATLGRGTSRRIRT